MALYLLPNAFPIRFLESGDLLHLHHKWVHRLCYTAQEEIWRASLEEVAAGGAGSPAAGRAHPAALHAAQGGRHHSLLPRGPRYCGVPVWNLSLEEFERLLSPVRRPAGLDALPPRPRRACGPTRAPAAGFSGLPPWAPQNPVEANRSVLFAPPLMMPKGDWGLTFALDYSSAIELYSGGGRGITFDAELGRFQTWLTRRIDDRWFIFGQVQIQGAYYGFMDRSSTGTTRCWGSSTSPARFRPLNKYEYSITYERGKTIRDGPVDLGIGDSRIGIGRMLGQHAQVLLVLGFRPPPPRATGRGRSRPG